MHRYLSTDIICSKKQTAFRERRSRKTVSFEEQISVQGQISVHTFEAKLGLLCLLPLKYFFTRTLCCEISAKLLNIQKMFKTIASLFKTFSSIQLSNLIGAKTECANVKRNCWFIGYSPVLAVLCDVIRPITCEKKYLIIMVFSD